MFARDENKKSADGWSHNCLYVGVDSVLVFAWHDESNYRVRNRSFVVVRRELRGEEKVF
jgi:hypothetical protein